ncbi:MAG: extracellular solute-binding protein [Oscillospiraceae bacterium]|nr:extracellular solute-binding protein [Oscillospiraceae bacterium]
MKKIRRTLAGVCALTMAASFTACGGDSSNGTSTTNAPETTTTAATTTAVTVSLNTETVSEEDQNTLDAQADKFLPDKELENKEIKWLAHYDLNPNTTAGVSESIDLNLFRTRYGGTIKYYSTTWNSRYADLSTYVLGGEGIDFFPCDTASLPKGVISGMFQAVDDYIDLSDPLWDDVKEAMEIYNFNGKHYEFVTNVSAEQVVIYNTQTLEENGLEDPWELYQDGEWNWDTFKDMLQEFVHPDDEADPTYGLDGYWAEKALFLSAGVPAVTTTDDGSLKVNLTDPTVEKAQNFLYDLYTQGLVINREVFDWQEQPAFMGDGRELFYIVGAWHCNTAPDTWATKIDPENLGIAPVPSPARSDPYQSATLDGWVLCKGAANPEGVATFALCNRLANTNDEAIAIGDEKLKADAQWSDDLIARNKEINDLAKKYPVVDLATGISTDVASITTDGGDNVGLRASMHGTDWATTRDSINDVLVMLVEEADNQLKSMS